MSGRGEISGGGAQQHRCAPRHKLFEPVTMLIDGAPRRAHLLDLSGSGALAHAETPPTPGAKLVVTLPDISLTAQVMWVDAKRFGLHFDGMLAQAEVDRVIGATPAHPSPKPTLPAS